MSSPKCLSEAPDSASSFFRFLWIYVGLFALTAVIVPTGAVILLGDQASNHALLISTAAQVGVILVYSLVVLRGTKHHPLLWARPGGKAIICGVSSGVFVFVVARLLVDGIRWISVAWSSDFSLVPVVDGMTRRSFAVALLLLAVVPAFCEELFYRVTVLTLMKRWRPAVLVVVSSLAFALVHLPQGWAAMVCAAILGYVLMKDYAKHQNYLWVVLVHFVYNALDLYFTYRRYWVSDGVYISRRAASGSECAFWGLLYIAGAIIVVVITVTVQMLWESRHRAARPAMLTGSSRLVTHR